MRIAVLLVTIAHLMLGSVVFAQTATPTPEPTATPDPNVFYSGHYVFYDVLSDARVTNVDCAQFNLAGVSYVRCDASESVSFQVSGSHLIIYTRVGTSSYPHFDVCIDSDCFTFDALQDTDSLFPVVSLALPDGVHDVTITSSGNYLYLHSFMVMGSSEGGVGGSGTSTTLVIEPPIDLASFYSTVNEQVVRFDYAITTGEFAIALMLFILICLQSTNMVFGVRRKI